MDDTPQRNRRRFLQGLGVGGGTLLAGCSQLGIGGNGDGNGGSAAAAAIPAVDQQAIQQGQARIQSEVQSGNMTQAEAQEEIAALQEEHIGQGLDDLESEIGSTDGVSVAQRYDALGAITLEGEAGPILGLLDTDVASQLVSTADVEEAAQSTPDAGAGTGQNDG